MCFSGYMTKCISEISWFVSWSHASIVTLFYTQALSRLLFAVLLYVSVEKKMKLQQLHVCFSNILKKLGI